MSRCESRTGTGHRCGLEQFHEGNHRCRRGKCEGAEWPNVPTIESAARKAWAVLKRNQFVWAIADEHGEHHWVYCPECESPERFTHAPKCALAEAISDLEKVL